MLNGATYEGYRSYIKQVKEGGYPAEPAPQPDDIELARLPTTQSAAVEVRRPALPCSVLLGDAALLLNALPCPAALCCWAMLHCS